MRKRREQIIQEIKNIIIDIQTRLLIIEQKLCKHENCTIIHATEGNWRGNDYVGGDIYTLICNDCSLQLDEVCNRWDTLWPEGKIEKLIQWRKKYKLEER